MNKIKTISFLAITFFMTKIYSQEQGGVVLNIDGTFDGYSLIKSISDYDVYLINNCGPIVFKHLCQVLKD